MENHTLVNCYKQKLIIIHSSKNLKIIKENKSYLYFVTHDTSKKNTKNIIKQTCIDFLFIAGYVIQKAELINEK